MDTINDIRLVKLPYYAYERYKKITKNNKDITHDEARRKLTRNLILGEVVYRDCNNNQKLTMYGRLKIRTNTNSDGEEVVTGIWNNQPPSDDWELHNKKFNKLNKRLGLEGSK